MIGMTSFKESLLDQLLYFMQGLHLNREQDFKHLVIYGPPGTGKSQVAKLIGLMYSKMGILKNGVFKKVTRNDLVAGYLGQTALKTQKVIQDCLGGCLFIDEVYSLGSGYNGGDGGGEGSGGGGDSYSKECIDTLCEALSDHKDDLMVIVAGYEADVKESFFKVNPGLPSRFIWRFTVEEYTADELRRIFLQKVEYNGWSIEQGTEGTECNKWFVDKKSNFTHFGRDMELLFTYTKIGHGRRIYGKDVELRRKLTMTDLDHGYKLFLKNRDIDKNDRGKMPDSCFGLYV
jgi:SpoVK/Ycf46/Vps4 family AAA+-type ATPase